MTRLRRRFASWITSAGFAWVAAEEGQPKLQASRCYEFHGPTPMFSSSGSSSGSRLRFQNEMLRCRLERLQDSTISPSRNEAPAKGGNVNGQAESHSADEPAFGAFVA